MSASLDTLHDWVYTVSWSPDGTKIAALAMEPIKPQVLYIAGVVQIWKLDGGTWTLHTTLPGTFVNPLHSLIWSPDSSSLLGNKGTAYIANAETGQFLQTFPTGTDTEAIAWFQGHRLAVADAGLFTYEMTPEGVIPVDRLLSAPIYTQLSWSPDGQYLAGGNFGGQIDVWDMSILQTVLHFDSAGEVVEIDWQPDGRKLATVGNNGIIEIWDTSSLVNIPPTANAGTDQTVEVSTGVELFDLAWSPDGQLLAAATSTGVKIFDNNLAEITQLTGHTGYVLSVAWKPDGRQLASGGSVGDHAIRIWDYEATTGNFSLRTVIPTVSSTLSLVRWSPDGTKLASLAELDSSLTNEPDILGDVQFWDADTFEPLLDEPYHIPAVIGVLDWSPDSTRVVGIAQNIVGTMGVGSISNNWSIPFNLPPHDIS